MKQIKDALNTAMRRLFPLFPALEPPALALNELHRFAEFGRLSSGLFHDLMGTLSLVALEVGSLDERSLPASPSVQASVQRSVAASRRMERLMSTIRKQVATKPLEEFFCLNEEIESVVSLFKYRTVRDEVTLQFETDATLRTFGDSIAFHHMLANLVSNALDSYEDLPLPSDLRRVQISLEEWDDMISVSVRDWGSGIPDKIKAKIFDPLFTTKSARCGMGLGLSNTKRCIEMEFGGKVRVEDAKGGGSCFILSFPFRNPPEPKETAAELK